MHVQLHHQSPSKSTKFSYNGEGATSGSPEVKRGPVSHLWRPPCWSQPDGSDSTVTSWSPALETQYQALPMCVRICTEYVHTAQTYMQMHAHSTPKAPSASASLSLSRSRRPGLGVSGLHSPEKDTDKVKLSPRPVFQILISCPRTLSQSMTSTTVRMFDPWHGHPHENMIHVSDGWMWALFPHSFLNMSHPSSS